METFQPYLSYIGIGVAIVGGIALLLWIVFAFLLSSATEGIPELLGKFFNYAAMGDFEQAYRLTTDRFQKSISKQQLQKLIQTHQIQKHKRILLPISHPEGDAHTFDCYIEIALYEFNVFSIWRSGMSHMTATRTYNAHASQDFAKARGIATA